ncbi:MAG: murein transglycosylase A [Alphaproteobacteria bacterium]|nr:murein transglycosylase A [Alphaproteobacteria bacterium]
MRIPSSRHRLSGLAAGFLVLLAVVGCAPTRPAGVPNYEVQDFATLPGWTLDPLDGVAAATRRSCERIVGLPAGQALGPAVYGKAGDWRAACAGLLQAEAEAAIRTAFETAFLPVALADGDQAAGLFTGYFEPELRGSRLRGGSYQTPILAPPSDLVSVDLGLFRESWRGERLAGRVVEGRLRPYDTRTQIEDGSLDRTAKVIAWVDDPVDAFFLHIQGSGRILLADGGTLRVGFAGQNGHPYVPIGRVLVERGALAREQVSMQSIRRWLADNPAAAAELMRTNPSYVFFREIAGDGPLGSEGVALTPGRSLAVDRSQVALGVPVWLEADDPLEPGRRIRRLLVAQDTGGAIRGIVRGDVYWGSGMLAAERAGRMRSQGRYWVLLPRAVALSLRDRSPRQ